MVGGTSFTTCWGLVEECWVAGELWIDHKKLIFFLFLSASACANRPLGVDQRMDLNIISGSSTATCRQPAQSCRQAHVFQNSKFMDCVYLSTTLLLLSTDTHRARKPELCLLPSVDSPFLAVDNTCLA
ncbi:hypothetical protein Taro_041350, partial [Colocasia esculenta]|nr:hypothetical protein [Colocasia esculenta]